MIYYDFCVNMTVNVVPEFDISMTDQVWGLVWEQVWDETDIALSRELISEVLMEALMATSDAKEELK